MVFLDDEVVKSDNVGMFDILHHADLVQGLIIVHVDFFGDVVIVFIVSHDAGLLCPI